MTFSYLVFSDIDVANSQTPKNIATLVTEIGLLPDEFELFGQKKAKVTLDVLDRLKNHKDGRYVVVAGYAPIQIQCPPYFIKKKTIAFKLLSIPVGI